MQNNLRFALKYLSGAKDRNLSMRGKGLSAQTSVLLNGISVAKGFEEPDHLVFTLRSGMPAGVYGVNLKTLQERPRYPPPSGSATSRQS